MQQPKQLKTSNESDQVTCVEAIGPCVAPDDIPVTSIPMASSSTPSSNKCHKAAWPC